MLRLGMATEELLEGWKKLNLTVDEEEVVVHVDREAAKDTGRALNVCLIGKLLDSRIISCEIIRNTMRSVWKIENGNGGKYWEEYYLPVYFSKDGRSKQSSQNGTLDV